MLSEKSIVGVIGAGAMGSGIAQVAAAAGHQVLLFDAKEGAAANAVKKTEASLMKLVEKGKMSNDDALELCKRISVINSLNDFASADLIIEAVVELIEVKKEIFSAVEKVVKADCVLATNTSSLSVTSVAAACVNANRVIGLHFFNPAPLMPLVEVIPAVQTKEGLANACKSLMLLWKKVPVIAKDTPGFIVNRVARPFYGESLKIVEEGIADMATVDAAMRDKGGFKMGPFELMDLIGNDINYTVTETVWKQFYFDARFRPSLIQKKMVESNRLGRKTGFGYYDYQDNAVKPTPKQDDELANEIVIRVLSMLINEAADALYYQIASAEDIDLSMTKGVNYPKGLLLWADEIGVEKVLSILDALYIEYHDDRYRASVLLRQMARTKKTFFN
ncbi:MAG: 3-hydroxyacyl-CoA dehydrogenase NAD-binding domain-containing protein [Bacteroidota bacterium]